MQDDPRYDDVVSEVKAFLEARAAFAVARGHRRGAHPARPRASASARPSRTTSSCCAGSTRSSRSASPCVVGTSRKGSSAGSPAARTRTTASPATVATNVLALERGATRLPRPRRRRHGRCPRGRGCYVARRWRLTATDDDLDDLEDPTTTTRTARRRRPRSRSRSRGLSLYTHHGVSAAEREVGQRLVLDLRLEVGECDATVTDLVEDTVDYGVGLRAGRARRPAAQLQDARAPVLGHRRPPARRLRRRGGVGQGDEARAADPAAGRVGVGRGLAPGRGVTAPAGTEFDRATAVTPLGDGAWAAEVDAGWFAGRGPERRLPRRDGPARDGRRARRRRRASRAR